MNDFEIWRRITHPGRDNDHHEPDHRLYVPAIEPVGDLPYELAGLLPNREHSRDLMSLIDELPDNEDGDRTVVGVFAADPFLNCKQVADHLIDKGYHQVANIPPIASYGNEFLSTLDKVSAGKAQENKNICQLADRGLSIAPAVTTIECLNHVMAWSPRRLWVVPCFSKWQREAMRAEKLLELCSGVARKTAIPIVLSAAGIKISVEDAIRAGANGILLEAN
jgi:hypothetical protein